MNNKISNIAHPVAITSHTQLTNLVLNLLAFSGAHLDKLTLADEPLTHDALDEEILTMLEDGTINQGFYIYWEQENGTIDLISIEDWETNDAEDEDQYTYHTFIATYDNNKMEITIAIN